MSTLNIQQQQVITCPATGYQTASVCVPVTVEPFAIPGTATTFCCGPPTVTPGDAPCPGVPNGTCTFTITQDICTAVSVDFGATTTVGTASVLCGTATSEDVCTNCGDAD